MQTFGLLRNTIDSLGVWVYCLHPLTQHLVSEKEEEHNDLCPLINKTK